MLPLVVLKAVYPQLNFFFLPFIYSQIRKHDILHTFSVHYALFISAGWILNKLVLIANACKDWRILHWNGWSGKTDHNMKGGECGSEEVKHQKRCVFFPCCSSLCDHFSWIRQTRGAEEFRGGFHSEVKRTEEEPQNAGMGVRPSATKGKSESVLSWKLARMWRTNKNKSVYLKGATGEGGVIWKETT